MNSEGKKRAIAAAASVLRDHGVNPFEPVPDEAYEDAVNMFYAELIREDDYQSLREALSEHSDDDVCEIFRECVLTNDAPTTLRDIVREYARPFIEEARDG